MRIRLLLGSVRRDTPAEWASQEEGISLLQRERERERERDKEEKARDTESQKSRSSYFLVKGATLQKKKKSRRHKPSNHVPWTSSSKNFIQLFIFVLLFPGGTIWDSCISTQLIESQQNKQHGVRFSFCKCMAPVWSSHTSGLVPN